MFSSFAAALLVAMLSLPAVAQAGSTLSGYGGPGEGNQAVLGSALTGVHRGGGSGPSSTAPSNGSAAAEVGEAGAGSTSAASSGRGGAASSGSQGSAPVGGGGSAPAGGESRPASGSGESSPRQSPAARALYPATERIPAGGQGTVLGLTGQDLLYVILGLVVLLFVGGSTCRLGGSTRSAGAGD
jgi:hypothetical protein